uniref:G_PROTEIN_RECEP_F1_2 domain-containing protein n=1 Tax=Panagrellus redivivus TaxID=6233 RepID=A0A7E4W6W7_PANRE
MSVFVFTIILYIIRDIFNTSHEDVIAIANEETNGAIAKFYNETTLLCFSKLRTVVDSILIVGTACITLALVFLLIMTTAFVHSLKRIQTTLVSNLSKSLYVSAIIQALLLTTIIFLPITIFAYVILFKGTNVTFANFWVRFGSWHGTVDTLSMLYFIVPYRKFCLSFFRKRDTKVFFIQTPS